MRSAVVVDHFFHQKEEFLLRTSSGSFGSFEGARRRALQRLGCVFELWEIVSKNRMSSGDLARARDMAGERLVFGGALGSRGN